MKQSFCGGPVKSVQKALLSRDGAWTRVVRADGGGREIGRGLWLSLLRFVSSVLGVPCGFLWATLQGPTRSPGVSPFLGLQGPGNKVSSDLFISSSRFLLLPLVLPITCGGIRNVCGGGDPSPPHYTPTRASAVRRRFCLLMPSGWTSQPVPSSAGIRVGGLRGLAMVRCSDVQIRLVSEL